MFLCIFKSRRNTYLILLLHSLLLVSWWCPHCIIASCCLRGGGGGYYRFSPICIYINPSFHAQPCYHLHSLPFSHLRSAALCFTFCSPCCYLCASWAVFLLLLLYPEDGTLSTKGTVPCRSSTHLLQDQGTWRSLHKRWSPKVGNARFDPGWDWTHELNWTAVWHSIHCATPSPTCVIYQLGVYSTVYSCSAVLQQNWHIVCDNRKYDPTCFQNRILSCFQTQPM